MKKLLFIFLAMLTHVLVAQESGAIRGKLIDADTKEALPGATVLIVGTYKGAVTDFDGNYIIKDLKPGDYSVKFSYIGFAEKIYTGIRVEAGKTFSLDVLLESRTQSLDAITIVGEKAMVNLESAASEVKISMKDISEMNTRDVQEIVAMQAGVIKSPDGLQIRGARVYETSYLIDGISATDPLAGTGFGVNVSSASISELDIMTGGVSAEYGSGSQGVISTKIREGGDTFEAAGFWQRDNLFFNKDANSSWNTDNIEFSFGGPVPGTKKKLTYFNNITAYMTDEYFGPTANQLHSSLFEGNDSAWAPRQNNAYTHTFKVAYQFKPGTKLTFTNQHSLSINQNTRSLQIVGFDAILTPGYQFRRSLNLDNATTYTHRSNLTALNFTTFLNDKLNFTASAGRLFTNLRADANGRPFRTETVDQIYDEQSIVTDPVDVWNSSDSVVYVLPGPWLINNNGISPVWHDHYVQEYTLKTKFSYYPANKIHQFSFGQELKLQEFQWVDVSRPWVGAPIKINDTLSTPSVSIGRSNDIWKVNPANGNIFVQDKITYKGIIASLGVNFNYWFPGKFADDAVADPQSPVINQVREDYMKQTVSLFGRRMKMRVLPRVNVSFPVTDNNVLYFNYGHFMQLPHPRFVYQALDPVWQRSSYLSDLGNPNLNPEVNVSYEVGLKSQITRDFGVTLAAFNNNRFDYIVSRPVITQDVTGRPVDVTMYINQDYAKIVGVEFGAFYRLGKFLRTFGNVTYQIARGKSNSARESRLQIAQTGVVELSREQYLAFDRPWNINAGITFLPDSSIGFGRVNLKNFRVFLSSSYTSGFRYTPMEFDGYEANGRPRYIRLDKQYLAKTASPWFNTDLKISRDVFFKKSKTGLVFSVEIRNMFNNKNAQIINPVTGRAYEEGDPLPLEFRDPRYLNPLERGSLANNPARYLAPRQVLYGISFRF